MSQIQDSKKKCPRVRKQDTESISLPRPNKINCQNQVLAIIINAAE